LEIVFHCSTKINFVIVQTPSPNIITFNRKTISKQDLITAPTESRFQVDIEKNWVESCKITGLLNELENLRSSGSKSIVFSQWTAFLDLLQIPFTR
jgi:DNA repair protein RAD5